MTPIAKWILGIFGIALIGWIAYSYGVQSTVLQTDETESKESAVAESTADVPDGWQTYISETDGFSIAYPTDWTLRESKLADAKLVLLYEPGLKDELNTEEEQGGYPDSAPVFPTVRIGSSSSVRSFIDSREPASTNTATTLEGYLAFEKAITDKGETLGDVVDFKPGTVGIYPGYFVTLPGDGGEEYMAEVDGRLYTINVGGVSDKQQATQAQIIGTFRVTGAPESALPADATDNIFDPEAVKVGDKLGRFFTVAEIVPSGRLYDNWMGAVKFTGSVTLSDVRYHVYRKGTMASDNYRVCIDLPDEFSTTVAIPIMAGDSVPETGIVVCMRNQDEAEALLGPAGSSGRATVTISDYWSIRSVSTPNNAAHLNSVMDKTSVPAE